jgi:flagellar protein FliL
MAQESEEDEEGKEPEAGAGKPKGKGKLIIIIAVAVVLVLGGAGAFLVLGKKDAGPAMGEQEEKIHYQTVNFGEFIVNLSSPNRYLKLKLIVEYNPAAIHAVSGGAGGGGAAYGGAGAGGGEAAKGGGLPGVFGEREAIIRDAIIGVLQSKTVEEVLSEKGKEALKEELVQAINEACALDEDPVVNVYFPDFLIQ